MSAFSEYAAASEWNTAIHRNTDATYLNDLAKAGQVAVPTSGDMLATITRGTPTQRRRRRQLARAVTQ